MIEITTSTQDRVLLTGGFDENGDPIAIDITILFTGGYRCQLGIDAPRSIGVLKHEPKPIECNRLPDPNDHDIGDIVSVFGVEYRLGSDSGYTTGYLRVWKKRE